MTLHKGKAEDGIKCEVLEKCGVISTKGRNSLELRYVKWNGKEARYDIRSWYKDDQGVERCSKGITLSGDELESLGSIIMELKGDMV